MIKVDYDGEYKGNVYMLYSDGWYCCESKSMRYRWLKPCLNIQSKLNSIAKARGYCLDRKPFIKEEKKTVSKKASNKVAKTNSKTFVSLF